MAARVPTRPDPDELLRKLEQHEHQSARGRLKVFLGYAPRVGKSVRMFDEGQRRASRGQDVLVGAIQLKGSEDVQSFVRNLETIPPLSIEGKPVLDTAAIIRRNPKVCLVDELAKDNPPGSCHPHRWEDVQDLVSAGITVITALNLQYVQEQQDAVERITGRRAACSVPQAFLQSADEIVVVDLPTGAPNPEESETVLSAKQLSDLRELALLLAAQVVEEQLLRYMQEHGIHKSWGTQERILVCITPRSRAREMLDAGARVTARFHAHLAALYVSQGDIPRGEQETVDEHLEYARKLRAEVHVLECTGDPIEQIMAFARAQRVTQVFIGHTQQSAWRFWRQNPVDRLIQAAEGMDVRIFPHSRPA